MAQAKGTWIVREEDYDTEADFRAAVRESLADVEGFLIRGGDSFIVASARAQDGRGEYYTAAVVFRKEFMPAARKPAADAPQEPDVKALVEDYPELADVEPVEA